MLLLLATLSLVRQINMSENDGHGKLNLVFDGQGLWDTSRSFSHERALFETKTVVHLKVTAECPMDLDVQKLDSAYLLGHFDTYLALRSQSGQKLQSVVWSTMHTSKIENY